MTAAGERVIDPVTVEVIRRRLVAIADEVDVNITRTAFSPYIYEYKDYAVGIVDHRGDLICQCTAAMPVFVADVAAAIARALGEPRTHGATLQLCGADVLTLAELVRYVRDVQGLRRLVVGLPDTLGLLQALVLNVVPGKPLSLDNFRSLKVDSICSESGLARLGIEPTPLGAVLPGYLGKLEQSARFDQFRRAAGERIGEP